MALLEVRRISKSFRGLRAVNSASFQVPEGDINGLIGPNGAGKTTIFNMIAGVYAPDAGEIVFQGKPIHGLRPDAICAAGIGGVDARDHVEDRRLARAVRADEAVDVAFRDGERRLVHRAQAAERLADRTHFEQRAHSLSLFASVGQMPCGRNITTARSTTP